LQQHGFLVFLSPGAWVIKILQGSAITQIVLGGLTMYHAVANFLQCIGLCAKNYYSRWLTVDEVIATTKRFSEVFGAPCIYVII